MTRSASMRYVTAPGTVRTQWGRSRNRDLGGDGKAASCYRSSPSDSVPEPSLAAVPPRMRLATRRMRPPTPLRPSVGSLTGGPAADSAEYSLPTSST